MRYTTVIDITEVDSIWRNRNAAIMYIYMALKSGYHDNDRDRIRVSVRGIASTLGLTTSATWHALRQLQTAGLIARTQDGDWLVKKYVIEATISPRIKTRKEAAAEAAAEERKRKDEQERKAWIKDLTDVIAVSTRDELEGWLQRIAKTSDSSRKVYHKGAWLYNRDDHLKWLKKIIDNIKIT